MTLPPDRLRALATEHARHVHYAFLHGAQFETCPHPDCVLVREAPPQEQSNDGSSVQTTSDSWQSPGIAHVDLPSGDVPVESVAPADTLPALLEQLDNLPQKWQAEAVKSEQDATAFPGYHNEDKLTMSARAAFYRVGAEELAALVARLHAALAQQAEQLEDAESAYREWRTESEMNRAAYDDSQMELGKLRADLAQCQQALQDLLQVIEADELIPETVSYMQQARETLARLRRRDGSPASVLADL